MIQHSFQKSSASTEFLTKLRDLRTTFRLRWSTSGPGLDDKTNGKAKPSDYLRTTFGPGLDDKTNGKVKPSDYLRTPSDYLLTRFGR